MTCVYWFLEITAKTRLFETFHKKLPLAVQVDRHRKVRGAALGKVLCNYDIIR